jgi:hypothetical protein
MFEDRIPMRAWGSVSFRARWSASRIYNKPGGFSNKHVSCHSDRKYADGGKGNAVYEGHHNATYNIACEEQSNEVNLQKEAIRKEACQQHLVAWIR